MAALAASLLAAPLENPLPRPIAVPRTAAVQKKQAFHSIDRLTFGGGVVRHLKIRTSFGCHDVLKARCEVATRVALKVVVELYRVIGFCVTLSTFRAVARRDCHVPGAMRGWEIEAVNGA